MIPDGFHAVTAWLTPSPPNGLRAFRRDGPLAVSVRSNRTLALGDGGEVAFDLYSPHAGGAAPLVIVTHGNRSRKEAHALQATRLASFGMRTMVVQLTPTGEWLANGRRLAALVRRVRSGKDLPEELARPSGIILVGHSFGGSAVAAAAGLGPPVQGLVLLDPAWWPADGLEPLVRSVTVPTVILAADARIYKARQRTRFRDLLGGPVAEVSVTGATHDDAQNPSMFALGAFGLDPFTTAEHRATFTAALTAAAFGLCTDGGLDTAWRALRAPEERQVFHGPVRRPMRHAVGRVKELRKSVQEPVDEGRRPSGNTTVSAGG